jgi:hypothetical protein
LQFFSFPIFSHRNSHTRRHMIMVYSSPSAIFSPTATVHQTHISPTVAPSFATVIQLHHQVSIFSRNATINGHKHTHQGPSWYYART